MGEGDVPALEEEIFLYGHKATLRASARVMVYFESSEGEAYFTDLPLEVAIHPMQGPYLKFKSLDNVSKLMDQAQRDGAVERELTCQRRKAQCKAEGHDRGPSGWCERCDAMPER